MGTKVPGGKAPEKIEPLLGDGQGVVAGGEEPLRPVMFLDDHQLPVSDETPAVSNRPSQDRPVVLNDLEIGRDGRRPKSVAGL